MARVTVEDCVQVIPNRFELVIMASQRAKQISSGSPLTQDRDNDKDAVVALREIADQTIDIELVNEELVQSHQKQYSFDRGEGLDDGATIDNDVEDAFADANQFIQEPSSNYAGSLSFIEDNVEVDD